MDPIDNDLTWGVTLNGTLVNVIRTGVVNRFNLTHGDKTLKGELVATPMGDDKRAIWHPNTIRPFKLELTGYDLDVMITGGDHLETSDEEWAREAITSAPRDQWAERCIAITRDQSDEVLSAIARTLNDIFSGIRWEATNR